MLMGIREYAKYRGCSHPAVSKAIKSGRIKVDENGKIDPVQADRDWAANTDISRASLANQGQSVPVPPVVVQQGLQLELGNPSNSAAGDQDDPDEPTADDMDKYRRHRAAREETNARIQALELAEREGKLIDRVWAEQAAFTMVRALRDAVFNLPASIKSHLSVMSDADQIEDLLLVELTAAFAGVDVNKLFSEDEDAA